MKISIIDNTNRTIQSVLQDIIPQAQEIRIASAYFSRHALNMLDASTCVSNELILGIDPILNTAKDIEKAISLQNKNFSIIFFIQKKEQTYHPKLYWIQEATKINIIVGSSNFTQKGIEKNIEVNVHIQEDMLSPSEITSQCYETYLRIKFHNDNFIPTSNFLDYYKSVFDSKQQKRFKQESKELLHRLQDFTKDFQRPRVQPNELLGWPKLIFDVLPPTGQFTNHDIYKHEPQFKQQYPHNNNIRAKIRQQLQILRDIGLIRNVGRGVWERVEPLDRGPHGNL